MKRRRKISFVIALEVILCLILISLPPFSVSADPEGTQEANGETTLSVSDDASDFGETLPDQEEITVLSVSVNINSEKNEVFTELLLQNTAQESREITFSLPEISAGMDLQTLTVTLPDGEESEAPEGIVTISADSGSYTGISYRYCPKKRISYEKHVFFDLTQLSDSFRDQIGHLEWTADLPFYELCLVSEIIPVNYTVTDNRIRVVLDDFPVSPLLNCVGYSQKTYPELLEDQYQLEERFEEKVLRMVDDECMASLRAKSQDYVEWHGFTGEEAEKEIEKYIDHELKKLEELQETDRLSIDLSRFIVMNYRKWYRTPHFEKNFVLTEEYVQKVDEWVPDSVDPGLTLMRLYLEQEKNYPKKDVDSLIEVFENPGSSLPKELVEKYGADLLLRYWDFFPYWIGTDMEEYLFKSLLIYKSSVSNYGYIIPEGYYSFDSPAFYEQMDPDDSSVYAILLPDSLREGKRMVFQHGMTFEISDSDALYRGHLTLKSELPGIETTYGGARKVRRIVYIYEKDCNDAEILRDTLKALNVKVLMRSDFVPKDHPLYESLMKEYFPDEFGSEPDAPEDDDGFGDEEYTYRVYFSYSGTERYPYEQLETDLNGIYPDQYAVHLIRREDPLADQLDIPVITQFWGLDLEVLPKENGDTLGAYYEYRLDGGYTRVAFFTPNTLCDVWFDQYPHRAGGVSLFLNCPVPKKMIEEQEQALLSIREENAGLISKVRDDLKFPKVPEVPISKPEESEIGTESEETTTEEFTTKEFTTEEKTAEEGTAEAISGEETSITKPDGSQTDPEGREETSVTTGTKLLWIAVLCACSVIPLFAAVGVTMTFVRKKNKKDESEHS